MGNRRAFELATSPATTIDGFIKRVRQKSTDALEFLTQDDRTNSPCRRRMRIVYIVFLVLILLFIICIITLGVYIAEVKDDLHGKSNNTISQGNQESLRNSYKKSIDAITITIILFICVGAILTVICNVDLSRRNKQEGETEPDARQEIGCFR